MWGAGDNEAEVLRFHGREGGCPDGVLIFLNSGESIFPGFSVVDGILNLEITDGVEQAGAVESA